MDCKDEKRVMLEKRIEGQERARTIERRERRGKRTKEEPNQFFSFIVPPPPRSTLF
jgi:hypothetical protein